MKILITGATGFTGRALCSAFFAAGHELIIVTRNVGKARQVLKIPHTSIEWDLHSNSIPSARNAPLDNINAVIHLAGESLVARRWTAAEKEEIRKSRVDGTRSILQLIKGQNPEVFITASAVGFYGDCGDKTLTESQPAGDDFLATVCKEWEGELFNADLQNTRKIALRFGVVLGKDGGALQKMLPVFSAGLGGKLGTGNQWMSWVHLQDLVRVVLECLNNKKLEGPINVCSPEPVTNKTFSATLAKVLRRPSFFTVPAFLLKVGLGEVSTALLSSQRAVPKKLMDAGFQFQYSNLENALKGIIESSRLDAESKIA